MWAERGVFSHTVGTDGPSISCGTAAEVNPVSHNAHGGSAPRDNPTAMPAMRTIFLFN